MLLWLFPTVLPNYSSFLLACLQTITESHFFQSGCLPSNQMQTCKSSTPNRFRESQDQLVNLTDFCLIIQDSVKELKSSQNSTLIDFRQSPPLRVVFITVTHILRLSNLVSASQNTCCGPCPELGTRDKSQIRFLNTLFQSKMEFGTVGTFQLKLRIVCAIPCISPAQL